MPSIFRSGPQEAELNVPPQFPLLIESTEGWDDFRPFKRLIASKFSLSDFGCEKVDGEESYIVFPLDQKAQEPKPKSEFLKFLQTHSVFSELSPKSAELYEIMATQKKKFADSHDFLKYTKIGMMKLVSQLIVLRKEVLKQETFSQILDSKCIPISEMGDLGSSPTTVSLRSSMDFLVQQALTILGAQKVYDDLLAHWNDIPYEEKQTRDQAGAAPFWVAQQEKFIEMAHHLRAWPEFGSAGSIASQPPKESLIWYGAEALTDTSVKYQSRQTNIKNAYHASFKTQRKHAALCIEASKSPKRFKSDQRPTPSYPTSIPMAPKPTTTTTLSAPRALFSAGAPPKVLPSKNRKRPPPKSSRFPRPLRCQRCHRPGHSSYNCKS